MKQQKNKGEKNINESSGRMDVKFLLVCNDNRRDYLSLSSSGFILGGQSKSNNYVEN